MPISDSFSDRLRGSVALELRLQVALDIDHLIYQILEDAVALWQDDDWNTYDKDEVNCTVQLYRWCRELCHHDDRFVFLVFHLEWINTTPEILAGQESVKSANRPDLRAEVGRIGRSIECKRLGPTGGWVRAYVYEGLARFVLGNYGHAETQGYMVGYAQADALGDLLNKINYQIADNPDMGPAQRLVLLKESESLSWSNSRHPRTSKKPISVGHLMINMSASSSGAGSVSIDINQSEEMSNDPS